jgi:hypothetical protein
MPRAIRPSHPPFRAFACEPHKFDSALFTATTLCSSPGPVKGRVGMLKFLSSLKPLTVSSNNKKINRAHKDAINNLFLCATIGQGRYREGRLDTHCNWQLNAGVDRGIPRESQPHPSCDLLNLALNTTTRLTLLLTALQIHEGSLYLF